MRVPVNELSRALPERLGYLLIEENSGQGKAASKALAHSLDIRDNSHILMLPCMERPAPSDTTHYLVENEQNTVLIAELPHSFEVSSIGRDATKRLREVSNLASNIQQSSISLQEMFDAKIERGPDS